MRYTKKSVEIVIDNGTGYANLYNKLYQLEDIEEELGIDLVALFDYKECPFCILELEQNEDNTIFFDGDSLYGHYNKEEFLQLIKRLIKAYLETWALRKEELK